MVKKIIPFDWDTYNSDKDKYTVVTRDGRDVIELIKFNYYPRDMQVLYGIVNEEVESWLENGNYYSDSNVKVGEDLMLQYVEELVESWVNVYKNNGNGPSYGLGTVYTTREECINHKDEGYLYTINLNDIVNYFNNYFS